MKASELRLGNFVLLSGEECQVQTVGQWIHTTTTIDEAPIEYVTPIPLTEEWLLKFGFVKRKMYGYDQHFAYHHHKLHSSITALYNSDFSICLDNVARGVVYVHQLQNLYFALTGEELTIKETVC